MDKEEEEEDQNKLLQDEQRLNCELCEAAPAQAYCAADSALLCFLCDASVHGANFLVARHARSLLCFSCSKPTNWRAVGYCLPPCSKSLCFCCLENKININGGDEVEEEIEMEIEEDEDEEEQVVPGELVLDEQEEGDVGPPEESSTSSSGEEEELAINGRKRRRITRSGS